MSEYAKPSHAEHGAQNIIADIPKTISTTIMDTIDGLIATPMAEVSLNTVKPIADLMGAGGGGGHGGGGHGGGKKKAH